MRPEVLTVMPTEEITIRVDPDAARAYREAPEQERRKLDLLLSLRLHDALRPTGSLQELMSDISRKAHERDDLAVAVGDLLEDGLEALLELAPVLGAGHQRADVQADQPLVLEALGDVALEAGDGRFQEVVEPSMLDVLTAGGTPAGVVVDVTDTERLELDGVLLLTPIDAQEVWCAGVTYERSRTARHDEAVVKDVYSMVYEADRPELFLKDAMWRRTVGPGQAIAVRSDSGWNVPEPEIGLVLGQRGAILGMTIGNDVSSREIEGENPLYLPQAKVYAGACAIGPSRPSGIAATKSRACAISRQRQSSSSVASGLP